LPQGEELTVARATESAGSVVKWVDRNLAADGSPETGPRVQSRKTTQDG
jgi:hypothetical protein